MATYIIQAGPTGPVKIGRADDPEARLASLQTGQAEELRIIRLVDTPYDCEAAFHERFAAQRLRGEWFRFDADMMTFIPPAPAAETVGEIMSKAREESIAEVASLVSTIWYSYRWKTRREMVKHLAAVMEIKKSRAHNLVHGRSRVIEYHEMIGLRAFAKKLAHEEESRVDHRGPAATSGSR